MFGPPLQKRTDEAIKAGRPPLEVLRRLGRMPLTVVCENIRSLYNVGSIFRTADGIRAGHLLLCGFTGRPPRREIDKVALGAVDSVPWSYNPDPLHALEACRAGGASLIALEHTDRSVSFQDVTYPFPLALVLGHEQEGLAARTLAQCDAAVEIPMYGIKQSLNVATAFGVVAYEILRQYLLRHSLSVQD